MKKLIIACLFAVMLWLGWGQNAIAVTQEELDLSTQLWKSSLHAINDINCASCHQDEETKAFVAKPQASCRTCHEESVDTFMLGKHGVRLLEGQSPLNPTLARLPMHQEAANLQMTCATCHDAHSANTIPAAVDSCLTCHADNHSLNYKNSRHAELFDADRELPRASATAVSCSTCHMARYEREVGDRQTAFVNHNNTYNLLPRDRMVGEVCINCHGVEYSYNSIFDDELVEANFDKPPTLEMQTFDLMRAAEERRQSQ